MIAGATAVGLTLWQAWAITVGSIVSAVVVLTILAKIPGGRAIFKFLVSDPVGRWLDRQMETKIQAAVGLQADAVKETVRRHVNECIEPIERKIDQINHAVNNVEPGTPPMKDRVAGLERGQAVASEKLDTLTGMVESLVRRP